MNTLQPEGQPRDPDADKPDADKTGPNKSIPATEDGVGVGADSEPNTFEPEEDPEAAKRE